MPDTSKLEKLNRELEKSEKKLRKAINDEKALQHQLKQLILLSYFLEMTDMEIAALLNMVRSSVAYRRTATLKLLKELMGGKTDDS